MTTPAEKMTYSVTLQMKYATYRSTKYNTFSTHALHIFVNEISSLTYTTQIFVLYHIILCRFFL